MEWQRESDLARSQVEADTREEKIHIALTTIQSQKLSPGAALGSLFPAPGL